HTRAARNLKPAPFGRLTLFGHQRHAYRNDAGNVACKTSIQATPLRPRRKPMALSCAKAEDVLKTIKDEKVQMVDLRFTDLPGVWQHFSVPPSAIDADALEEGIGFDGSSIRGFQEIQESDMLVVPDPTTAFLDPFATATTLVLICNVRDPVTGQTYTRDARY